MGRKIKSLFMGDGCETVTADIADIKARYKKLFLPLDEDFALVANDLVVDLFKALEEGTSLDPQDVLRCHDCGSCETEPDYDTDDYDGESSRKCIDCGAVQTMVEEVVSIEVVEKGKPCICSDCGGQVEVTDEKVSCLESDCGYVHIRGEG